MNDLKKDLENINSNWDYGIRSSNLWQRMSGFFLRNFNRRQAQLNASMVRILNALMAEREKDNYRIYYNREVKISPGGEDFDYFGFESAFRPSEEIIKERQRRYIEFFKGKDPVVDIGCGRGEFLDLLKEEQIEAIGVDVNKEMLERCRKKGCKVVNSDFMEHMASMPDVSAGGIFSAQFVEHIPFDQLDAFFKASYKKL
ncbi:MAG: class I SAM-dependent methyltransferase, partial [Thermodesulfobacteriota bacterium]